MSEIEVSKKDFITGIRTLAGLEEGTEAEIVICKSGDELEWRLGGSAALMSAEGTWREAVRVPASVLASIEYVLPEFASSSTVKITSGAGKLSIGSFSVSLKSNKTVKKPVISLPKDAPLLEVLRFARAHSSAKIKDAGLAETVRRATKQRDKLIDDAAKALKPLGITRESVVAMVEAKIL